MSVQVPKGYEQTEVGVIPEDWSISPLGDLVLDTEYGSSAKSKPSGKIPVLRMGNLQDGAIDWSSLVFTDDEYEINKYNLELGDVLFNRTNTIDLVGKTSIYKGEMPAIFAGYLIRIKSDARKVNSFYLNRALNAEYSKKYSLKVLSIAVGQANINAEKLKTYPIPLPPTLAEQDSIAEALSEADALIESLEQLITKKRQIKQGAMQELLTGQRRLPGFSGEWVEKSLGSVISGLNAGVSVNSEECDSPLNTGKPCILKTSAVFDGIFLPEECKLVVNRDIHRLSTKIKKDTLVISRMNTPNLVGEVGYVKRDYDNLYLPDRLWMASAINNEIVHIRWLSYIMSFGRNKEKIKELATGTSGSMKNISKDAILSMKFIFPEIQEQVGIGDVLADMDKEIESLEAQLFKARQIKQSMMQELLTGRIRLI